jgi:hypothetical protein
VLVDKLIFEEIPTRPGQFVTNCLDCNWTCHEDCSIVPPESKEGCASMSSGYCTVCPKKCNHERHRNATVFIRITKKPEWVTKEELFKEYTSAETGKMNNEKLLE